jgi:hypothetical protein
MPAARTRIATTGRRQVTASADYSSTQSALRWRAVGMWRWKQPAEQKRSFSRPALQDYSTRLRPLALAW